MLRIDELERENRKLKAENRELKAENRQLRYRIAELENTLKEHIASITVVRSVQKR
jgi:cell division protein FtsB